jgi:dinuclear metal center YbgI/SA1388 family protein
MIKQAELLSWLNNFLASDGVSDYCPNGLQVEGKKEISKIVTGVSASEEFLQAAIAAGADAVLVHHGLIWKGDWNTLTGPYKRKIALCLEHNVNVFAYHLPLDAHLEIGNAAQLAARLGIENAAPFAVHNGLNYGVSGELHGSSMSRFAENFKASINEHALILTVKEELSRVAIVTGGGQGEFQKAIDEGFDLFITGEASEWVYHLAKEHKVNFIGGGHHATERFGAEALGAKISTLFDVTVNNIDITNPI